MRKDTSTLTLRDWAAKGFFAAEVARARKALEILGVQITDKTLLEILCFADRSNLEGTPT
jgi:hypothetical protein